MWSDDNDAPDCGHSPSRCRVHYCGRTIQYVRGDGECPEGHDPRRCKSCRKTVDRSDISEGLCGDCRETTEAAEAAE